MQRPWHFRREQYDKEMFTYPKTSSRDALNEPSRKRKSSHDHWRHMPAPARSSGFNRRTGPKSYADDLRDKEFRGSIPASRRESSHFRDYDDLRDKDFRGSIPASPHRESSHFRDYDDLRDKDFRGSIPASPRRESSHFRNFDDMRDKEFRSSIPASPRRESSYFRDYDDLRDKEFRRSIPASPRRESSCFRDYDGFRDKEFQSSISASPRRESSHFRDYHLRDKEFRSSIPVSSRREPSHFRDYPRKTHSWDKKNYAESCHSDKSDNYYNTKSENTEHGFFRGHSQTTYCEDFSPLSVGQVHRTSKRAASMTENSCQFEHFEGNARKAKDKSVSHFPELWGRGPEKPYQMEAFTSSSRDRSYENIGSHVSKTGAFGVNIHGRDHQTCRASRRSPSRTEAVTHFGSHESNVHVAMEENASDFQKFSNSGAQKPEQVNLMASSSCDIGFKNLRESQGLQQDLQKAQAPTVRFDKTGWQTHKVWPPAIAEHCDQQSNREQHASNFEELQNFGPQHLASSSHEQASINIRASQSFKQNFCSTGSLSVNVDARCYNEEAHKSESSSDVKSVGEASAISGFDNVKILGENVPISEDHLQNETNRLLQNALRLLSAAAGIVSADNSGGKVQSQDDVKIMKLLLDSGIQNLQHSLVETTVSKNIEASPKLDKSSLSNGQDSVGLDDQCKNENKAAAFTDKLWDGTLQLSTAVSVSAVAFFKSGEKMQDFSWSGTVEVKGKVRLEAFEKYVQDLPRSRSRGLMVVSFCSKDGSSDNGLKGMNEIAEKYKERKKVGFAQVSSGVDLYICPHSDAVITILAKHGFFKGTAAVIDKTDPLIGCVVWRKNPCSMKAHDMEVENKNLEPVSFSSSLPVTEGTSKGDKLLETNVEVDKSNNVQPPTVADISAASDDDDDDDLPEYDFGATVALSLGDQNSNFAPAEKLRDSGAPRPLSTTLIGPESSAVCSSRSIPDCHLGMQPQEKESRSKKPVNEDVSGRVPEQSGEPQNSNLGMKRVEPSYCKPSTLFDDEDDIPEWCPPGFDVGGSSFMTVKLAADANPRPPPGFDVGGSSYMTVTNSKLAADSNPRPPAPPPLPPTPPPAQAQLLQLRTQQYPPRLPASTPLIPPADGFLQQNPEFVQNHAAAATPRFDPRNPPHHHSPWRPSPSGP